MSRSSSKPWEIAQFMVHLHRIMAALSVSKSPGQSTSKQVLYQPSLGAIVSGLGSVSFMTGLIQFSGALQLLDGALLDQAFRIRQEPPKPSPVVIVTMGEEDIQRWGHPLSDAQLAKILGRIQAQQPRVIGLALYRNLAVPPGQAALDQVFRAEPKIIGVKRVAGEAQSAQVPPTPVLQAKGNVAASDIVLDPDGKLRRALISLKDRSQKTYYTLGTRLALDYLAQENIFVEPLNGDRVRLGKAIFQPLEENTSGYIRADTGGYQILSNFYQPESRPVEVSITAVLTNTIPPNLLKDKIVLLGTTASSLGDRFYVPYSNSPQTSWAGVEVHADLAAQLVEAAQGRRLTLQGIPWAWNLGWMIFWAGTGTTLGWWSQRRWTLAMGLGFGWISLVSLAYGAFLIGYWIPVMGAGIALLGGGVWGQGSRFWGILQRSYEQLESYSRTLETTVQLRTLELQEKNQALEFSFQQAQSANRAKSAFLASMNHEFRTPLTIILGSSELMQKTPNLSPQQKGYLESIDRSVSHLLELINDVLDLSRLEASKMDYQPGTVQLLSLVTTLSQLFRSQAQAKNLAFQLILDPEVPSVIETDERKLRQILINLLGNAIKFTQQGQVSLAVRLTARGLQFRVADTGIGIAPEEWDQVFVPFYQSHSHSSTPQGSHEVGSGLGLAISQQFAQILGGTLTVRSALGVGSTFQVLLPLQCLLQGVSPSNLETHLPPTSLPVADRSPSQPSHLIDPLTHPDLQDYPLLRQMTQLRSTSPPSPLNPDDWLPALRMLPMDWRQRFFQGIIRLNSDRTQALLVELPPEQDDLRQQLQRSLEAFQFDEIQRLLQQSLADHETMQTPTLLNPGPIAELPSLPVGNSIDKS